MNILSDISSGTISGLLNGVGDFAVKLRTAITGDLPPEKKAELTKHLSDLENQLQLAQVEVDKIEAGNGKLFIAGWRPFIGWVCGFALFYHFIGRDLFLWIVGMFPKGSFNPPPELSYTELFQLVLAMLGLGTLRTYEKVNNAEGNR